MKKLTKRERIVILYVVLIVMTLTVLSVIYSRSRFNVIPQLVESYTGKNEAVAFPDIKEDNLSVAQQKVLDILRAEYKQQPGGKKYSEGVQEAWCADFVSWVFNQAGVPLKNPNTGYWRIPGTYTLRDYYEQAGKFKAAQSGYSPKVGDVMLYDNPSPFGQHVNIVIKNDHGVITTIGGNEPGGIRIVEHKEADSAGFIGYGIF